MKTNSRHCVNFFALTRWPQCKAYRAPTLCGLTPPWLHSEKISLIIHLPLKWVCVGVQRIGAYISSLVWLLQCLVCAYSQLINMLSLLGSVLLLALHSQSQTNNIGSFQSGFRLGKYGESNKVCLIYLVLRAKLFTGRHRHWPDQKP